MKEFFKLEALQKNIFLRVTNYWMSRLYQELSPGEGNLLASLALQGIFVWALFTGISMAIATNFLLSLNNGVIILTGVVVFLLMIMYVLMMLLIVGASRSHDQHK